MLILSIVSINAALYLYTATPFYKQIGRKFNLCSTDSQIANED
ncbi:hypothetical protein VAEKB19_3820010 [Vibrio aestuarianus]|nr:hypothetical protein VAEKB19_3820010 [Vibrio aestuarianus]